MDALVDIKKLSNGELCTYFWANYDLVEADLWDELRKRSEAKEMEFLFELEEVRKVISVAQMNRVTGFIDRLNVVLFNDLTSRFGEIITPKGKNDAYFNTAKRFTWLIANTFRINEAEKITPVVWILVIGGFKEKATGKWVSGVNEHTQSVCRRIAKALGALTNNSSYWDILRIPRSSSRVSVVSETLPDPRYNRWLFSYKEYVETRNVKSTKEYSMALRLLMDFLSEYGSNRDEIFDPVAYLATAPSDRHNFYQWITKKQKKEKSEKLAIYAGYLHDFCDWLILQELTDYDEDSGESVTIGYQLLSAAEHTTLRLSGRSSKKANNYESPKKIMPRAWMNLCKEILTEKDFEWPKTRNQDYFMHWTGVDFVKTWNPVNTYVFLFMLELPLRKIQVISLDSGEGDTEKYDIALDKFLPNDSIHANTWRKRGSKNINRGVIQKQYSQGAEFAGLWINTNKTQDRNSGFGELTGYPIPWKNLNILQLITDIRGWQEKYNPVKKPRRYQDVAASVFTKETSETAKENTPARFYLFRTHQPMGSRKSFQTSSEDPPTDRRLFQFWYDLMAELESRLRAIGEDVSLVTFSESGQAEASIFTPHGLRVSGLTAFVEAGVPVEILSKIVAGHASILMSLHYIKFNPARISEILNGAQKHIEETQQKEFSTWLKNASFEDIKVNAVPNDEYSLASAVHSGNHALFESNSIGICPWAGTRCWDGGECIKKDTFWQPVEEGDCLNCRHFITGAPWLVPLWIKGNKLLADAHKLSLRVDEINRRLQMLEDRRFSIVKEFGAHAVTDSLLSEIKKEQGLLFVETTKLDKSMNDAHVVHNLVNKINALSNEKSKFPILFNEDFDKGFNEEYLESSRFRSLDLLTRIANVYTHVKDPDFESERNQFIDRLMFEAGVMPISFSPLTGEQKKIAHDAASGFLASRLSDEELNSLENGKVTLSQLGVQGKEIIKTVKLISNSEIPLLMLNGGGK